MYKLNFNAILRLTFIVLLNLTMGCEFLVENQMAQIEKKVAEDTVQQYNIAKNQGNKLQTCVQAGMVSAAYLQAKDQTNYNKWKKIERSDCKAAGMPQF